jgi:hypothetical protein
MPAPPDYLRILTDARDSNPDGPDAMLARARGDRARKLRIRRPRWLTAPTQPAEDGSSTPILRDYPWRSSDRA